MQEKGGPECGKCRHFYVTWDPAFPYGCKGFGMKSKRSPSLSVYLASGARCRLFAAKSAPPGKRSAPRSGISG